MPRYQVRYHRAILDSGGRLMFPSGTIVDSLEQIPPAQHDRMLLLPEDPPAPVLSTAKDEDELEED